MHVSYVVLHLVAAWNLTCLARLYAKPTMLAN